MEKPVKKRKGMSLSTAVLIGASAIVLTLIGGFVLLWVTVIKPGRDAQRSAGASAAPTSVVQPTQTAEDVPPVSEGPAVEASEAPASTAGLLVITTAEPAKTETEAPADTPTEIPTEAPTEVPTEVPSPTPTEIPTPKPTQTPQPTKVPDSFKFGGKTIKRGT
jgi:outer membrane biosynthesis protein TonB